MSSETQYKEVIETRSATIALDEDSIVHVTYRHVTVTVEDAKDQVAIYRELGNGQPVLRLVDMTQLISTDGEVRQYGVSPETIAMTRAMAVISNSFVSKMLANFFLKFNKPPFPVRLFTDKEEAIDWLKQFLD